MAPASWLFVQAGEALIEEPLPPFTDDLPLQTEARGDDVVSEAGGGQEDNLRPGPTKWGPSVLWRQR